MTTIEATELLRALTPQEKISAAARLAHELTIIARDNYDASSAETASRYRTLNEIQHKITSLLIRMIDGEEEVLPDSAVAAMFLDAREDKRLQQLLKFAFERMAQAMSAAAVS